MTGRYPRSAQRPLQTPFGVRNWTSRAEDVTLAGDLPTREDKVHDPLTLLDELPALNRPIVVAAFEGWNDAGESATTALEVIRSELSAEQIAQIEAEEFFDFQAVRPMMRVSPDGQRRIDWPDNRFWATRERSPHDLVLLTGVEPSLRWKQFCDTVLGFASGLQAEMLITLGGLQVDVPHTRPVPVTATTSNLALAEELGIQVGTYEGPTGITGVLHTMASQAGIPSVSVWTGVPHYLASTTYLPGALSLAEQVGELGKMDLPLGQLAQDAVQQSDEIAELVQSDEDLSEYVDELESRSAGDEPFGLDAPAVEAAEAAGDPLPSDVTADDLAAELEEFLRDNGDR